MNGEPILFTHEKLEAYKVASEFLALADGLIRRLPRGTAKLAAQLGEAAESILFNTAEGANRRTAADKVRFFDYAHGSAGECAAALDAIRIRGYAPVERVLAGRVLLDRAARLLTGLMRAANERSAR